MGKSKTVTFATEDNDGSKCKKRRVDEPTSTEDGCALDGESTGVTAAPHEPKDSGPSTTTRTPTKAAHTTSSSMPAAASTGTATVYIGGVPNQYCTESVVEKIMSRYGTIVRCSIVQKADRPTKFCFCEFATVASADAAVRSAHGRLLGGQRLIVRPALSSSSNSSSTSASSPAFRRGTGSTIAMHASPGSAGGTGTPSPKRQAQQINSRIEAIQQKLAAKAAAAASAKAAASIRR